MQILIVGAGPTGLLLAIELARRGVDFRIVDRGAERSRLSKAMVVQVRTLEVYDALGIAEEALRAGQPFTAAEFHPDGGAPLVIRFGGLDSPHPRPLILEQSENERILEEKLAALGCRVERGTELLSAVEVPGALRCVLRGPGGEETWEPEWMGEKYRLSVESYLLVRPDGYVASMGPIERLDRAERILEV